MDTFRLHIRSRKKSRDHSIYAACTTELSHSNSNYASTINVGTWDVLQFFLQLLLDEFLRVGCNFICLVAEYKHRKLFLHYSCLCQNVIQVPAKSKIILLWNVNNTKKWSNRVLGIVDKASSHTMVTTMIKLFEQSNLSNLGVWKGPLIAPLIST